MLWVTVSDAVSVLILIGVIGIVVGKFLLFLLAQKNWVVNFLPLCWSCVSFGEKRASELLFITGGSVPVRQSPMAAVHLTIIHHYPEDVKWGAGHTLPTRLQLNLLVSYQVIMHIIVQQDQIWCQKSEKSPGFHASEYKVAERPECVFQWTQKCLQSLQARLICPSCLGLCCPSPHTVQDRENGTAYYCV